jgi:uncharacterized protein YutE (UPF0331/DUF86 family)
VVDPARARRLLEALASYRDQLAKLRDLPPEDYLTQQAFAGRYLVQASAQTCIDLANHVIASSRWRAPRDFRDTFTVLEENGVLDSELGERLRALASLRNRLVHLYEDVDDSLGHRPLPDGLRDLEAFGRAVARLVESSPRPPARADLHRAPTIRRRSQPSEPGGASQRCAWPVIDATRSKSSSWCRTAIPAASAAAATSRSGCLTER